MKNLVKEVGVIFQILRSCHFLPDKQYPISMEGYTEKFCFKFLLCFCTFIHLLPFMKSVAVKMKPLLISFFASLFVWR